LNQKSSKVNFLSIFRVITEFIDPEWAHNAAISALKMGIVPSSGTISDPILKTKVWGLRFENPIGLAAGFDKNGEVVCQMLSQGFGFIEIGTVTPLPQEGNNKPRLFRLPIDEGIINRLGFNNKGSQVVLKNLFNIKASKRIIGINLGKNKDTESYSHDYILGLLTLAKYASYIVINISSPNTPGLRKYQRKDILTNLLYVLGQELRKLNLNPRPPLLLKVAPDLTDKERYDIAQVVMESEVDGLIATNTTISRPGYLRDRQKSESGGLSGQPLFDISTRVLSDFFRLTEGRIPIVGVGGVSNGYQAYQKIRAGASLVQLYSALVYKGPSVVKKINKELAALLRSDGYEKICDAVGADVN